MSAIHVRRLRLGAALVLLTYLILHFSNHALGIISLDAMARGALVVPRAVAQRAGHAGALRRHRRARRAGAVAAVSAPDAAHAGVGGDAVRAGPDAAGAAGRSRRGYPHRVVAARRRRSLHAHRARALGAGAGVRRPPDAHAGAGVDPRVYRRAFLAPLPSVVSARAPLALRGRAAAADAGPAGLRRRRPRGVRAGAHAGLDRGGAPRAPTRRRGAEAARLVAIRETLPDRLPARAAGGAAGARRSPDPGVAARGADHVPVGSRRGRAGGIHHPGRQPDGRHPARLGVRRTRALLDLPRANRARPRAAAAGRARPSGACSRGSAPRPTCGWPARPGRPTTWRSMPLLAPSVAPADAFAHRRPAGPRAGAGRALRRPARLHAHGRAQAAVRRRLLPQPLLRGGGHRDHAARAASPTSSPATA